MDLNAFGVLNALLWLWIAVKMQSNDNSQEARFVAGMAKIFALFMFAGTLIWGTGSL